MWGRCCCEKNQRQGSHKEKFVEDIVEQYRLEHSASYDIEGMTLWGRCCGETRTSKVHGQDISFQRPAAVAGMAPLPLHEVALPKNSVRDENVAPLYDVTPAENVPVLGRKPALCDGQLAIASKNGTSKGGLVNESVPVGGIIAPSSTGLFGGCNGCSAAWHTTSDEDPQPAFPISPGDPRSAAIRLDETARSWRQPRPEAEGVFMVADELRSRPDAVSEVSHKASVLCSICSAPANWLSKPKHFMCCKCRRRSEGYRLRCEACDFDLCTDCCLAPQSEEIPSEGTRVRAGDGLLRVRQEKRGSTPEDPAAVKAASAIAASRASVANRSPKSRLSPQLPNTAHSPPPQTNHDPADDDFDTLREVKNAAKMAANAHPATTAVAGETPTKAPASPTDSDIEDLLNMSPEDRRSVVKLRGEQLTVRLEALADWCNAPLPRPGTKISRKDRLRMAHEDAQRARAEKAATMHVAVEFKPPPRGNMPPVSHNDARTQITNLDDEKKLT